jgi:hypothetical protein
VIGRFRALLLVSEMATMDHLVTAVNDTTFEPHLGGISTSTCGMSRILNLTWCRISDSSSSTGRIAATPAVYRRGEFWCTLSAEGSHRRDLAVEEREYRAFDLRPYILVYGAREREGDLSPSSRPEYVQPPRSPHWPAHGKQQMLCMGVHTRPHEVSDHHP